jgi:hypothetical protein
MQGYFQLLALRQQLAAAKLEHEHTARKRQITATDRQIDQLVYELYGLSEEEIKIVEGGFKHLLVSSLRDLYFTPVLFTRFRFQCLSRR